MSDSLTPTVAARTFPYAIRTTLGVLGLGLVGAAIAGTAVHSRAQAAEAPPVLELSMSESTSVKTLSESKEVAAADPRANEVQFVIAAGGAQYIALVDVTSKEQLAAMQEEAALVDDDSDPALADYSTDVHATAILMPKHGTPRLVGDADAEPAMTIATVKASDVPADYREWLTRKVELGGHCTTAITGFAVITQVAGYADYTEDGASDKWTAKSIASNGASVLAAKLADTKCESIIARDASLHHAVVLDEVKPADIQNADEVLLDARAKLVASPAASVAQKEWADYTMPGKWDTDESTTWEMKLYVHPNGAQYVMVHASQEQGCGGVNIGMVGIYKLEIDGRHTALVPVTERALQGVTALEQLVDLNGDGQLQIVGRGWLGLDHVITTAAGAGLTVLDVPFVGCPC